MPELAARVQEMWDREAGNIARDKFWLAISIEPDLDDEVALAEFERLVVSEALRRADLGTPYFLGAAEPQPAREQIGLTPIPLPRALGMLTPIGMTEDGGVIVGPQGWALVQQSAAAADAQEED